MVRFMPTTRGYLKAVTTVAEWLFEGWCDEDEYHEFCEEIRVSSGMGD
jgi:hypothetical protein